MTSATRWGLLGAGQISRTQAGVLPAADGAELFAVGARDVERARQLGARRAYGSYQEVLDDPEVDAVYVGLPNDAHLPWTAAALEAGKPVLCEKPLGLSVGEVDAMAAVAERTGGLLVEASWYRWHPRTQLAARMLAEGAIGTVTSVSAGFSFGGVPAGNFRLDPGHGGGALYDIGCYALSGALLGAGQGLPSEVECRTASAETGVDLTADVLMTWASGLTGEVHVSMAEPERQWLIVRGEAGELEFGAPAFTATWAAPAELLLSDGRGTRRIEVPAADPYKLMFEQTSAVARGEDGWVLPLADSRQTAALIDAALASAADGSATIRPSTAPAQEGP
jgi:predicted dehydrogenase